MTARHGNKQKHESKNPIQRALVGHFKNQVVRMVQQLQPRTILEVGCGEGYVLDAVASACPGAALHGVDISAAAIDDARARLGDRADLRVQDARELADSGEQFDVVMMLEVLEHIEHPTDMLPILQALANPHLILSVPWEPFFRGLNFLRGKHVTAFGNDPEHINHWGRRDFLEFIGRRFDVVETPLVFPWTMALATTRSAA